MPGPLLSDISMNSQNNPQDMLSYAHFTDEISQDPEYWEHYFSSLKLLSLCIYTDPYIYTHRDIHVCKCVLICVCEYLSAIIILQLVGQNLCKKTLLFQCFTPTPTKGTGIL